MRQELGNAGSGRGELVRASLGLEDASWNPWSCCSRSHMRPSQEWLLWGPLVSDIRRSTSGKLRAGASGQRGPALPLLLLPEPGERSLPFSLLFTEASGIQLFLNNLRTLILMGYGFSFSGSLSCLFRALLPIYGIT